MNKLTVVALSAALASVAFANTDAKKETTTEVKVSDAKNSDATKVEVKTTDAKASDVTKVEVKADASKDAKTSDATKVEVKTETKAIDSKDAKATVIPTSAVTETAKK